MFEQYGRLKARATAAAEEGTNGMVGDMIER
jgi:hypothetical protein